MRVDRLNCPACGASLAADAVDVEQGMATCCHCRSLFAVGREEAGGGRRQIAPPSGMEVQSGPDELVIRWPLPRGRGCGVVLLALVWLGVGAWLIVVGLSRSDELVITVLGAALVLVGLITLFPGLACLVNHATLRATRQRVTLRHGPIGLGEDEAVRVDEIEQFYCRENRRASQYRNWVHYSLWYVHRKGPSYELARGLETIQQALYIEQELERFLGIQDRPVPDEVLK